MDPQHEVTQFCQRIKQALLKSADQSADLAQLGSRFRVRLCCRVNRFHLFLCSLPSCWIGAEPPVERAGVSRILRTPREGLWVGNTS